MKKIILILISSYILFGCVYKECEPEANPNSRIKLKESIRLDGFSYQIIIVDSTEYLTYYNGGIIELKKK